MRKFVVWFREVDKHDLSLVGGKGANLGEMTKAGIPMPNGFIVTAEAYYYALEAAGIKPELRKLFTSLKTSDNEALQSAAKKAQAIIEHIKIPDEIADEILKHYEELGNRFKDALVAVRSSATAEDLPTASFAGQQATFLNIHGDASVIFHVRKCWASLFTARAIFYRVEQKFDHFKVGVAVPVQKMVQSDRSGIMFTVDPVTSDKKTIVIEGIYGLGELIVQGAVTPDHFEVDKATLKIKTKTVGNQEKAMVWRHGKTVIEKLTATSRDRQKVTDSEVVAIAKLGVQLEKHYYFPQDIEWAIENKEVFITQTRPITTLGSASKHTNTQRVSLEAQLPKTVLLTGDPASPGIACGPVQIIKGVSEIGKVHSGDVLVAAQTNPDYVPAMRKAVAIITETGGRTSHAAIVSRELGIPAVVGARDALKKLINGQVVTVHGSKGVVLKGGMSKGAQIQNELATEQKVIPNDKLARIATRLYVNLAEPDKVHEVAQLPVDGVGLLRAEFMIAGIGTHPKKFIRDKKQHVFVDKLSENLKTFCEAFHPRPVVYRATDFRTNEYRNLIGGKEFEPEEANPMLGYRGAFRYISDPAVFKLELAAIKRVRNRHGLRNLWLMIPFVHTPEEMIQIKKIVASEGLNRGSSFKLWMMCELPANVILLDQFIDTGIDGISIGSNDLTMLILGVDRDNSEVAQVFNERNPAVLWALERVITTCRKRGVTVSICGQAPSDYPELVEKLVDWGITSVSVNRDVVVQVHETIHAAELKLLAKKGKKR